MLAAMEGLEPLIKKISAAVRSKDVKTTAQQIKKILEDFTLKGNIHLPADCQNSREECYARRLLHKDDKLGYVMVAMTWGPGQGTPLHDHSGIWCVECVIQGEMNVTHFELQETKGEMYRFLQKGSVKASVGGAGALIPPFEHHLLENALKNESSITLHVYGNDMSHCNAFTPEKDGWYKRRVCDLTYHS